MISLCKLNINLNFEILIWILLECSVCLSVYHIGNILIKQKYDELLARLKIENKIY